MQFKWYYFNLMLFDFQNKYRIQRFHHIFKYTYDVRLLLVIMLIKFKNSFCAFGAAPAWNTWLNQMLVKMQHTFNFHTNTFLCIRVSHISLADATYCNSSWCLWKWNEHKLRKKQNRNIWGWKSIIFLRDFDNDQKAP